MASMDDDSPSDRKRKKPTRKGPHDIIKKMAVVLTEGVVGKNKEANEVFMPTTITMSNEIYPDPRLRQEILFTKSMTPEDIKEVIKNTFPILANAERFFCAKAVQKVKLDFCGERCIWSGEVLNREIRGHSVLYIYWEEENNDQQPSLTAQVENMQISRNGHSSDTCDSGIEFSEGPLPVNNRQDDDVQRYYPMEEETNEIFNRYPLFENSPLDSPSGVTHAFHVAGSEVNNTAATQEHTLSHLRVEGEDAINSNADNLKSDSRVESTEAVNSEEEVNFPSRVEREDANSNAVPKSCDSRLESAEAVNRREEVNFPSRVEREDANSSAVPKRCDSRVESAEAVNSGEEVNFPSRVEREDANSNAVPKSCDSRVESAEAINSEEKVNLVEMIVPSSSPLKGGGQFLIVLKDVLPGDIRGGYANFGQHRVELKKVNNVNLTGIIPAAQKPGPVTVQVYSQSERLLGEIYFQYIDLTDRVAYEAVQHGIKGVTELFSLMGKHSVNMWNQSASVKQNTVLPGQATDAPNDGSEVRLKDGNEDLMQVFEDRIKCLLEENCGHCPTNTDKWIQLSRVVCEIYEKFHCSENFKGNQQTCPQEREEPYFADAENSSCMSSEDDNASLSDPDNCCETPNGCSHQALCSEEITSYTLMASQDDTPVLCLDVSVLNVENEESKDKDDELFETLITENDSPKHSDSSISVTSNQQSPTHPGSITQEAPQSPLRNTWWNDIEDSKLSVAPAQGSDEKIHSGLEWEESAIIEGESLASWFDLCENEDAGKDEHSRWEISSIEPNKTDGGVEKDVFDSEEGLSQEQELFYEQGNSHIHLSLPDDTSVQSRRPEVENKESQLTPLFEAARNGHTDIVRLLIENGADVNEGGGDAPIVEAARNGQTDIVRLLIENGADVNKEGPLKDTPLCEAARNGHTDIVRLLIENGADVNKRRPDAPIFEAARNGHTYIVRLLIENGADVNKRRPDAPIFEAARNGQTDIVRLLIENGADVNKGEWGDTPLVEAASNAHTDIVRLLIENGADVNKEEWEDTPLIAAVRNSHYHIARLLIENGADVSKEVGEDTPLIVAVRNSYCSIARLLIEKGADVNKEVGEDTPLIVAARNSYCDIARLLIEKGADVNKEVGEYTPLIVAVRNSKSYIARLLMEKGADVKKEEMDTLFTEAVKNGDTGIVRLLVENGADVNTGSEEDTPLIVAVRNSHHRIASLLIDKGADVNKEVGEDTPLIVAVRNSHHPIASLLIENGADVNKEVGEDTPLIVAARNGNFYIARLLMEKGADVKKEEMRTINIKPPEVRLHRKFVAGARVIKVPFERKYDVQRTINIEPPEERLRRKFVAGARVTKVPFERKYDVQLKGKKIESLPKMSGKKLITQTEMTCPRDIVEEGECGRDPMKDVESGLSSLHLSPGCEQFYPCIMDESPGDSRI